MRSWTALTSASVTLRRSVPLGRYPRTSIHVSVQARIRAFSVGLRASGSGFCTPLSTGGCREGRGRRSARRRASGGGRRPVLPHAPVAREDVRGHDGPAHDRGHRGPGCLGSIPACAGEPLTKRDDADWPRVYPRVCGGALCSRTYLRCRRGLSPRVRGSPAEEGQASAAVGSIPACAGEPPSGV